MMAKSRQMRWLDREKERGIIRRTYPGTIEDHIKLRALSCELKKQRDESRLEVAIDEL